MKRILVSFCFILILEPVRAVVAHILLFGFVSSIESQPVMNLHGPVSGKKAKLQKHGPRNE